MNDKTKYHYFRKLVEETATIGQYDKNLDDLIMEDYPIDSVKRQLYLNGKGRIVNTQFPYQPFEY